MRRELGIREFAGPPLGVPCLLPWLSVRLPDTAEAADTIWATRRLAIVPTISMRYDTRQPDPPVAAQRVRRDLGRWIVCRRRMPYRRGDPGASFLVLLQVADASPGAGCRCRCAGVLAEIRATVDIAPHPRRDLSADIAPGLTRPTIGVDRDAVACRIVPAASPDTRRCEGPR